MAWELQNIEPGSRTSLKWVSFVVAIWLMVTVGTQDTFSLYSPVLKNVLNYDQLQLMTLGGAKETGKGFGLIAGILSFLVPLWVMLTAAIVESIVGFGFLWLVVSERIAAPPFKIMYVMMWITGNSITWINTAAIVVSIQNFPFNRGTVVGILKGIQALSAAIYIQLGAILFSSNIEWFLLLLAFLPAISCVIGILFLCRIPPVMSRKETHDDKKTFLWIYVSTMILALYLLSYNISSSLTSVSQLVATIYILFLAIFVAVPLIVPLRSFVCLCWTRRPEQEDEITASLLRQDSQAIKESAPLVADTYSHESQWMHDVAKANQSSDIASQKLHEPPRPGAEAKIVPNATTGGSSADDIVPEAEGQESSSTAPSPSLPDPEQRTPVRKTLKKLGTHHFTVKDAWGAKEFWLLFFSFFGGLGMSITLQANLSQVAEALGYGDVALFLTIFTVSTFFGRVLGGGISEFLIRLAAIPRPFIGAVVQVVMVLIYVQMALAIPGILYVGTCFAGITAGVEMTVAIATASELFGLKYIGMLYNFLLLVYPLTGNLFSGLLVGKLYNIEAHKVGTTSTPVSSSSSSMTVLAKWTESHRLPGVYGLLPGNELETCVGAHCFRSIFFIMAAISAVGAILNIGLLLRVRRLYRSWYWNDSLVAHVEDVPAAPLLISHV